MATSPIFSATPKASAATISVAETSRTAPTNVGTVFTAGSNGSRVERVIIQATATTTAGMIRLWLYNGSSYYLIGEVAVTAITPSGTVVAFQSLVDYSTASSILVLPTGWSLRASTVNAEAFTVTAIGGDF